MPLTQAQKSERHRAKRKAEFVRYREALVAIAGGCTMPSQTARNALNPEKGAERGDGRILPQDDGRQ